MANQPDRSAKNLTGDFAEFTDFMKRLIAVPHSEIKARIEADKAKKKKAKKRKLKASSASLSPAATTTETS